MRSVETRTVYSVGETDFDSFDSAKSYALTEDLIDLVGTKLKANATTHQVVEFLFVNKNAIRYILTEYQRYFETEERPAEGKVDPSEDPVSPSPTED